MTMQPNNINVSANVAAAVIATVFTAYMAIVFGFGLYLFTFIVPDMKNVLGFDYLVFSAITAAAQIAFLGGALVSGKLAAVFGAGRVIVAAVVAAGIALLLLSAVSATWQAAALLTLLGACAACMVVPTVEVVGGFVPFQHRSKVTGLIFSGAAYGQFVNGMLAPFFILHYTWQALWAAVGAGALAIAAAGAFALNRVAPKILSAPARGATGIRPAATTDAPGKARLLIRANVVVWALLFLNGATYGPWQNFLSPYVRDELGMSVQFTGHLWSVIGFLGLWSGFAIGVLADKIGVRFSLLLSYVLLGGAGLLVTAGGGGLILAAAVLFGLGFYAVFGLIPAYISKTATVADATRIFGVANIMLGLGTAAGNFLSGVSRSLSGTFVWTYLAGAVIAAVGIVLIRALPDERTAAA